MNAQLILPEQTDTHIIINNKILFEKEEFFTWKNGISLKKDSSEQYWDVARNVSTVEPAAPAHIYIIEQIKNFDLSHSTPMECMNFLATIKKDLQINQLNNLFH